MINLCHDCGVAPGEMHLSGCDVERCPNCGGQLISCDCFYERLSRRLAALPWTGEWPGVAECREFGWYCYPAEIERYITDDLFVHAYKRCGPDHPDATEDLNRLYEEAVWDRSRGRFVLREDKP